MALTKVSTPAIKDEAITLAKLLHGDSNSNGKFLEQTTEQILRLKQ